MCPVYTTKHDPHSFHDVLPMLRDLYSKRPETRCVEPHKFQSVLWSLGYCEDLIPEGKIAAAIEVARTAYDAAKETA
jgi:hypothetical protein